MTVKKCNSLPANINVDRNNIYNYTYIDCGISFTRNFTIICNEKYKSPDCINEYYSFGTTEDISFNDGFGQESIEELIKLTNRFNTTHKIKEKSYKSAITC